MRLNICKTSKSTRLYAIKSTYDPKTRKTSSKIAAKLGTAEEIMKREGISYDEAIEHARKLVAEMTTKEGEEKRAVRVSFAPEKLIDKDIRRKVNAGYLFPKKICSELGIRNICNHIASSTNAEFDLGEITETLILGQMLSPSSKRSIYAWAKDLIEQPKYLEHQAYRALSVLAEHSDDIQAALYKASSVLHKRKTGILYYDCTNYFFEVEEADEIGDRQYGISKEHKPNPIVQMGLFMDADGIPLAFSITPGNLNEQKTLLPLEKTIIKDFKKSEFVVCTDAGLSSQENRKFNTLGGRSFVMVQSIKKMKGELKTWALDRDGWRLCGQDKTYHLHEVDEVAHYDDIFYKERWIKNNDGFEQRYVVTFSFKYMEYQRSVREGQVERAAQSTKKGAASIERRNQNDPARFVKVAHITKDGEVANKSIAALDEAKVSAEALYDGFSCIATTLEDDPSEIVAINKRRWQIEECFRIMKTEFRARPVYLSRPERIRAHFLVCFMTLLVYRLMDERINHALTCEELLSTLSDMTMVELPGEGWIPAYTRTDATDIVHEAFGFRTDYEIVTNRKMRTILSKARGPKAKVTK